MKTRSAIFLTLSLIVHAICITALALSHFKSLEAPQGGSVEVAMGDTVSEGSEADANVPAPQVEPLVEKVVEKEVIKPQPNKPTPKPKAKKIVKVDMTTELPKKEQQAAAVEKIENMSPEIDSEDAVAVVPDKVEADKVEMLPVKEQIAGVESASDDSETEAQDAKSAEETNETSEASGDKAATAPSASPAGSSRATAVSYLQLNQYGGNVPPVYPLSARQAGRQGQVDLVYRVTKEGLVGEIQIAKSSGYSELDEAAIKAIAKYRFVPGQEGWARHPVIFTLKTDKTAAAE